MAPIVGSLPKALMRERRVGMWKDAGREETEPKQVSLGMEFGLRSPLDCRSGVSASGDAEPQGHGRRARRPAKSRTKAEVVGEGDLDLHPLAFLVVGELSSPLHPGFAPPTRFRIGGR